MMGLISHFITCLEWLEDWTTFTGIFFCLPYSGSFSEYFLSMHMIKVPRRYSQSLKVYDPHQGRELDQLLPNLRLISGAMGRKSVTYLVYLCCRAEEWFARGRYLIKFRSYGVTNVQGRGRNGLTLWKYFWVILLNSSFALFLLRIMSTSSFFFSLSFLLFLRR